MTSSEEYRAVRPALREEVEAISALINEAYLVESFFVEGPRITNELIETYIGMGQMLVLQSGGTELLATAHLRCHAGKGHLGLISVSPAKQGLGLGRRIIAASEQTAASLGCTTMHIQVVNLRSELPGFYRSLGYLETGTSAFADPQRALKPVHFIEMQKKLPGTDTHQ